MGSRGAGIGTAALVGALLLAGGSLAAQEAPAAQGGRSATPVAAKTIVAGSVVAADGGNALPAAMVVVTRESDGATVGSAIAGPDGRFRVAGVPAGRYAVVATHLGYRAGRATVTVAAGTPADAGTIRLATAPIAMAALQVEAKRSPVVMAPDRSVYTTKDMPVAATGMATDVLRHIPEVDVDVNGKVSLRGSSNVAVQINGRPAPVRGDDIGQFLQQFPANRIERIEVVPNPSAKSEAEGSGGIVNIVLKQGADLGLSGSLGLNTGTRVNGASGRVAYQQGRLTFFGNGSFNLARWENSSRDLRENLLTTPLTTLSQTGSGDSRNRGGMLDLSAELKLSKRSVLWLGGTGFHFQSNGTNLTDYLLTDTAADALQRYDRGGDSRFRGTSTDLSLGYRRVVQPQRDELSVEVRGTRYLFGIDGRSTQDIFGAEGEAAPGQMSLNHVHHVISELALQADYTHPLGKATKLEAGARLSSRPVDYDNQLSLFASPAEVTPQQIQDGSWKHRASVNALYGTLTRQAGRVTAQAGMRAEDATSSFRVPATGERFDYSYRDLFPSAALAYDLKGGREVRLAYSKRIDRPYPMFMNPYVPSADPLNRQMGNPYLAPKYTQSLTMDMSWTLRQGSLRLSPYYRETVDNWDQIKVADTAGVAWLTWKNLAQVRAYGTTVTGSLRQWGPLSGFASIGGFREVRDGSNLAAGYSGSSLRLTASTSGTVTVNSGLDGQFQVNYQPPHDLPQGRVSAMVTSSLGVRQKLRGTQTSLTLAVVDPLNLWHYDFVTRDPTHVQSSHNARSMRRVNLSLNYVFGGKTPQQMSRRTAAEDPQSAGSSSGPIH